MNGMTPEQRATIALDAEAKVAELTAEANRLGAWAKAREAGEDEILALLATIDLVTAPEAWELAVSIISHLDGPPACPTADERDEGLRALITKLAARVAELEAEKDTREGESTLRFHPVAESETLTESAAEDECSCPEDGQYVLEIDCGSISILHKACGKARPDRGDALDTLFLDAVPVTLATEPYGNCDGSRWHGEHQCDCGTVDVITINGLDKPEALPADFFQVGRLYTYGDSGFCAPELALVCHFRVEHVTRHPVRGHLRAIGWMKSNAPGSRWRGYFQDEDEFDGWTEVPATDPDDVDDQARDDEAGDDL
ncbi:hypothetical protein [Streptomyces liangshanensis]|uniref:hypothetical protein n=1 Tax=Streptomyces liangshanensis TaxID=2717324 RepID=UPI0036DB0F4F